MSRTKAMQSFTWSAVKKLLAEHDVTLHSAGLDEVPGVYKNIAQVMAPRPTWSKCSAASTQSWSKCAPAARRPKTRK